MSLNYITNVFLLTSIMFCVVAQSHYDVVVHSIVIGHSEKIIFEDIKCNKEKGEVGNVINESGYERRVRHSKSRPSISSMSSIPLINATGFILFYLTIR